MGTFSDLFAHGRTFTKCEVEAIPVASIVSASAVRRSKDGSEWTNVVFTLSNGGKRECKISKESAFADSETGDQLPVSGEVFRLSDEDGTVTSTIYWEEA